MIHQYQLGGSHIVLDVCSGAVHAVDELAYDMIGLYEALPREEVLAAMAQKHPETPAEELAECYEQIGELKEAGQLFARQIPEEADHVVGELVNGVHRAGADVEHDIEIAEMKTVDHRDTPLIKIKNAARNGGIRLGSDYLFSFAALFSQRWLAMPQLVLQADWQEVWHSPQPPLAALSQRLRVLRVRMCFISGILPLYFPNFIS